MSPVLPPFAHLSHFSYYSTILGFTYTCFFFSFFTIFTFSTIIFYFSLRLSISLLIRLSSTSFQAVHHFFFFHPCTLVFFISLLVLICILSTKALDPFVPTFTFPPDTIDTHSLLTFQRGSLECLSLYIHVHPFFMISR